MESKKYSKIVNVTKKNADSQTERTIQWLPVEARGNSEVGGLEVQIVDYKDVTIHSI